MLRTKIYLYGACAWGLLTLFLLLGMFTKNKDFAVIGLEISAVVWVQSEIIRMAISSFSVLRGWKAMIKRIEEEVKKETNSSFKDNGSD